MSPAASDHAPLHDGPVGPSGPFRVADDGVLTLGLPFVRQLGNALVQVDLDGVPGCLLVAYPAADFERMASKGLFGTEPREVIDFTDGAVSIPSASGQRVWACTMVNKLVVRLLDDAESAHG